VHVRDDVSITERLCGLMGDGGRDALRVVGACVLSLSLSPGGGRVSSRELEERTERPAERQLLEPDEQLWRAS
jgi:hypothetical protein